MARRLAAFVSDSLQEAELWCEGRSPWLRGALAGYLGYAGVQHLLHPDYRSWFAGITLGFHELGHLLFAALGNTMMLLGGSIMQLLVPAACSVYLLRRQRDPFGFLVAGAWLSFSLWELAAYVYDAPRERMPLVGFGDHPQHDWSTLLTQWQLLNHSDGIAAAIRGMALLAWAVSTGLALWLCWVMWRTRQAC